MGAGNANRFMHRVSRPSPALIIALIALMVSLGGTGYAAFTLPRNSVGNKQLKSGAVTAAKVKRHSLTGAQINLRKLGTVPTARDAGRALKAGTAAPVGKAGGALAGSIRTPSSRRPSRSTWSAPPASRSSTSTGPTSARLGTLPARRLLQGPVRHGPPPGRRDAARPQFDRCHDLPACRSGYCPVGGIEDFPAYGDRAPRPAWPCGRRTARSCSSPARPASSAWARSASAAASAA